MKSVFAAEIEMEENEDSTAERNAAIIDGVSDVESLELDALRVTFEDVDGGTFVEYFDSEAEVARKYGQEVAEIVNEMLWNGDED